MNPGPAIPRVLRNTAWVSLGAVILLFLPLALSGIEYLTTQTDHVEDWCRAVGIHGFLDEFYESVFGLFSNRFRKP